MRHGLLAIALLWTTAVVAAQTEPADDVQALADRIDERIAARWAAEDVIPAPAADDAEFLRRVSLDIAGTIPPVAEVRAFLDDQSPDKRRRVVDRLLEGPGYITHFATVWRTVMIPEANSTLEARFLVPGFEAWLRGQLTGDVAYDEMVRELLTAAVEDQQQRPGQAAPSPVAFYQARQAQPENLAAATSRAFLGVRIECAQCHDHPFDHWKREQFWSYAAFFAGLQPSENGGAFGPLRESADRRELAIPDTEQVVQAAYLDGSTPQWTPRTSPRATLADWVTSQENPYFARAAVNRLWAQLFGTGLVDPVDDFSSVNPSSHPELLDELAAAFAEHDFDLKFLIRALTASRAYQLTSRQTHPGQADPRLFARAAVRGLTPEQIYASVIQAAGIYEPFAARGVMAVNDQSRRGEFLDLFANESDAPTEQQTTVLQALALMNGGLVAGATSPQRSQTLAAVVEYPLMTTAERIETLYLATLSRRPTESERSRLVRYVESGGPADDPKVALGDVFWSLLNSSEFLFNH